MFLLIHRKSCYYLKEDYEFSFWYSSNVKNLNPFLTLTVRDGSLYDLIRPTDLCSLPLEDDGIGVPTIGNGFDLTTSPSKDAFCDNVMPSSCGSWNNVLTGVCMRRYCWFSSLLSIIDGDLDCNPDALTSFIKSSSSFVGGVMICALGVNSLLRLFGVPSCDVNPLILYCGGENRKGFVVRTTPLLSPGRLDAGELLRRIIDWTINCLSSVWDPLFLHFFWGILSSFDSNLDSLSTALIRQRDSGVM